MKTRVAQSAAELLASSLDAINSWKTAPSGWFTPEKERLLSCTRLLAELIPQAAHVVLTTTEIFRGVLDGPKQEEFESLRLLPKDITTFEFQSTLGSCNSMCVVVSSALSVLRSERPRPDFPDIQLISCIKPNKDCPGLGRPFAPSEILVIPDISDVTWKGGMKGNQVYFEVSGMYFQRTMDLESDGGDHDTRGIDALESLSAVLQAVHSLRAGATLEVVKPVAHSLRSARLAKNGCAGFSYHVVQLPANVRPKIYCGGTHASPRLHSVRAHIRHYNDGDYSFVRWHVRGNRSKGEIKKDYVI